MDEVVHNGNSGLIPIAGLPDSMFDFDLRREFYMFGNIRIDKRNESLLVEPLDMPWLFVCPCSRRFNHGFS